MSTQTVGMSQAAEWLSCHDRYVVLTHNRPDGDTIGSAAALVRGLRSLGKTAHMLENPGLTPRYAFLCEGITVSEAAQEDTVVSVDTAADYLLPDNARPLAARTALAVDHHDVGRAFAQLLFCEPGSAATGELVYALLVQLGVTVTPEIADALYAAVSTDTGCFKYDNTTARTHRIAADLTQSGARIGMMNKLFFETRSRSQIAIEKALLSSLRFFAEGRIALGCLSAEDIAASGATEDDMESLSGIPRTIEGVRAAATLTEKPDGIKLSVRSDGILRACDICAVLGGGGHPAAAGAMLHCPMEEACRRVLRAIYRTAKELPWKENEIPDLQ